MKLELFLLLVAGATAAPKLPPPLGLLAPEDGGPAKILCFAPRSFAGSTFELFAAGASVPVQSVSAQPGQHKVDFTLDGASQCYRCRYRSYNGSAWQTSAFSVDIVVNALSHGSCHASTAAPTGRPLPTSATLQQDRSWLLPVAVGTAGLVLLLLVVAAVVAARRVKARRQWAKRQRESCWTETRCPTTELCYDNGGYGVSLNVQPGAGAVPGTSPVSPQRDPRASSPAAPHFSTFRASA